MEFAFFAKFINSMLEKRYIILKKDTLVSVIKNCLAYL